MGLQSYDGRSDRGYLGLVVTEVEYIMQVPVEIFTHPGSPVPTIAILNGATTVEAYIMIQEHGELLR
jgi:hypothetical protein